MQHQNYSLIYRLLHWAIAITMILLAITIFLRMTWLNKNNIADIIGPYISATQQTLTHEQVITLAKQIRAPMWQWHIYLGYVLVGLFSIRMMVPLWGEMPIRNPFSKHLTAKERLQLATYVVFYICIVISLATGLFIKFGSENLKKSMETVHTLSLYYFIPFLLLHFGGVLIDEIGKQSGIVSRIINGKK
ncbi:MAG: cytochrome B [Porphyromonadaceae bacterium CG2_30_38_12]|nr:MAG: cytochrome B [Porphyromonadaceae bacterium CG2_30_38_12]